MKYKVFFPITRDMSPIDYVVRDKPMETKEDEALWHYNKSREHDGLRPLGGLPRGTRFEVVYDSPQALPSLSDLSPKVQHSVNRPPPVEL